MPERFDLADWLEHSFGVFRSSAAVLKTIRIHFERGAARYVRESCWHKSQKLVMQRDGTVIAEFRLTDLQEIKHWIMSFGSSATALDPPELVEQIQAEL